MDLDEYQEETSKTAIYPDLYVSGYPKMIGYGFLYPALGLAGETGEVLEIIKKTVRNKEILSVDNREKLKYELGDVFWYLSQLATELDFTLNEVAEANIKKLRERYGK